MRKLQVSQSPNRPHPLRTPTRGATNATCRTCKSCRQKKIKCDGQHPQCRSCQSKGIDCIYPQDARRSVVRARNGDVRGLQRKIEALQEQLSELTEGSTLAEQVESPLNIADQTRGALSQYEAPQRQIPYHPSPSEATYAPLDEGSSGNAAAHTSYPEEEEPILETAHSPEATANDGSQVYGATSLLHDQSSDTPLANQRKRSSETRFLSLETVQDHLIAYAAIRRQEELSLASAPSIAAKIDFDGVPVDLALHLLELHWNRQHLSYLLTYRPAIMDSLVRGGPYMNKLLLNALYLQSGMYSDRESSLYDRQETHPRGLIFYERFKALLPNYIDKPTIPTALALLTCGACMVPYGYQSAGWALSGMAYHMIIDLGCHLDSPATSKLTAIEQEMKKRIYWGAFVSDKFQALFLGRPISMHEYTGNVTHDYLDTFEEMEEWKPYIDRSTPSQLAGSSLEHYRGRPVRAISTFQSLLGLSKIAARIIEAFYSVGSSQSSEPALLRTRSDVNQQLHRWESTLPSWLRFDPSQDTTPPPHQITPHALYWTLIILTEQAFLNRGRFNLVLDPGSAEASRKICIQAALSIWKLVESYKRSFTLRRAQYGISYATYCAALVMLQHTSHESNEHVECIQFLWTALLDYQKGTCYGLKRPLKLLKSLMRRLGRTGATMEELPPVLPTLANSSHSILDMGDNQYLQPELWDASMLGDIPDDVFLADDSIFGMFGG